MYQIEWSLVQCNANSLVNQLYWYFVAYKYVAKVMHVKKFLVVKAISSLDIFIHFNLCQNRIALEITEKASHIIIFFCNANIDHICKLIFSI